MTLQLNNDMINFFSDIKIRFEWNNNFYIDFMDYFPLLKKGITTKYIYYSVIATYGLMHNFIDIGDLINHQCTNITIKDEIIMKIYDLYSKSSNIDKILSEKLINSNIINVDIVKLLIIETDFAQSLLDTMMTYCTEYYKNNNDLFELINLYDPKSLYNKSCKKSMYFDVKTSKIFDEALKIPSMRLLSNTLYNDNEDMVTALYIDEIEFYVGYMNLYLLAISRRNIKIAKMLKEKIITQNLNIKQVLVSCFENLIGPSNIPTIIYNRINNFKCY